jgi:hypothetical protein
MFDILDTPSRTSWEDDDDGTPLKKSSWDLPTPSPHSDRDRNFERSHRSQRNSGTNDRGYANCC